MTGVVRVDGSLDTFYAGYLITGQASGQEDAQPQVPQNFAPGRVGPPQLGQGIAASSAAGPADLSADSC